MKARNPLLSAIAALSLACTGAALAHGSLARPGPSTPFPTTQGQVTIHSTSAAAPQIATPPPFKQLAGNGKWITQEQATAYPPLANDFLNASHGAKHVSKTQYDTWVKQIQ